MAAIVDSCLPIAPSWCYCAPCDRTHFIFKRLPIHCISFKVETKKSQYAANERTSDRGKTQHQRFHCKFEFTDGPNRAPRTQLCNKQRPRAPVHTSQHGPGKQLLQNPTQCLDVLFERVSQPISVANDSILIWTNASVQACWICTHTCAQLLMIRSYILYACGIIVVICNGSFRSCHTYGRHIYLYSVYCIMSLVSKLKCHRSPPMYFDRFPMVSGTITMSRWDSNRWQMPTKCLCIDFGYAKLIWQMYVAHIWRCSNVKPPILGHSAKPHAAHTRQLSMVYLIHFNRVVCLDYCILKRFHNFQFYLHLSFLFFFSFQINVAHICFVCAHLFFLLMAEQNEQKHQQRKIFRLKVKLGTEHKYWTFVRESSLNAAVSVPHIGLEQFINFYN